MGSEAKALFIHLCSNSAVDLHQVTWPLCVSSVASSQVEGIEIEYKGRGHTVWVWAVCRPNLIVNNFFHFLWDWFWMINDMMGLLRISSYCHILSFLTSSFSWSVTKVFDHQIQPFGHYSCLVSQGGRGETGNIGEKQVLILLSPLLNYCVYCVTSTEPSPRDIALSYLSDVLLLGIQCRLECSPYSFSFSLVPSPDSPAICVVCYLDFPRTWNPYQFFGILASSSHRLGVCEMSYREAWSPSISSMEPVFLDSRKTAGCLVLYLATRVKRICLNTISICEVCIK